MGTFVLSRCPEASLWVSVSLTPRATTIRAVSYAPYADLHWMVAFLILGLCLPLKGIPNLGLELGQIRRFRTRLDRACTPF